MKGHIRERGKGAWAIVLDLGRDENGKRRQKWHTVKGGKREAQRELTRLLNELNTGSYVEPSRLTLGAYLQRWLKDYARGAVAAKTYQTWEEFIRIHITPAIGHIPLTTLKPLHIQTYEAEKLASGRRDGKGGLSAQTVLHHHRLLFQALQQAVRWQILVRNPAEAVEPPKVFKKESKTIDEDGSWRLLEAAEGSWLYLPILLGVTLGLRRGEVLALRWADVDLERRVVAVRRSLEQTRAGLNFKPPKNDRPAAVKLPELVAEELRRLKLEQAEIRLALGPAWQNTDLIVTLGDGRPRKPDNLTHAYLNLRRRVGCEVNFHGLRHSHATILLVRGVQPKVVSERLRHSSIAITQDLYSHVMPTIQEGAAAEVDSAFQDAREKRREARLRLG